MVFSIGVVFIGTDLPALQFARALLCSRSLAARPSDPKAIYTVSLTLQLFLTLRSLHLALLVLEQSHEQSFHKQHGQSS